MPTPSNRLDALHQFIDNRLPDFVAGAKLFAGSIGESPSKYSRSPGMWNAAFRDLGLDAAYVPFDVRSENLAAFVGTLRELPGFMGANVTVPHKLAIMELLDEVDLLAKQIGAVNTFARVADGRLIGYNTDAEGLIGSILRPLPDKGAPFLPSLEGKSVLLLGAGGAGRASAFALARNLEGGPLFITNRSLGRARELAAQVAKHYANVQAISQGEALDMVSSVDLVVNASTVGQSGIRQLPEGKATCLEPFSSLAPASPAVLERIDEDAAFYREWFGRSLEAIEANQATAARALLTCAPKVGFVDAVYSPDETVLLRQARWRGHKTLNGKGMLIMQATESFVKRMTRTHLEALGYKPDALYDRVLKTMAAAF